MTSSLGRRAVWILFTRQNIISSVEIRYFSSTARNALLPTSSYTYYCPGISCDASDDFSTSSGVTRCYYYYYSAVLFVEYTRGYFYRVGQRRNNRTTAAYRLNNNLFYYIFFFVFFPPVALRVTLKVNRNEYRRCRRAVPRRS